MMFLRNLVLVTLLAASATADADDIVKCGAAPKGYTHKTGFKKNSNAPNNNKSKCFEVCGHKCKLAKTCLNKAAPSKECYNLNAYKWCEANVGKAMFNKAWFDTLSNPSKRRQAFDAVEPFNAVEEAFPLPKGINWPQHTDIPRSDCSTTPAVCLLSNFEEDRTSVQLSTEEDTFRPMSEYQCFERIAVHECMLENKQMYNSISREKATTLVKSALNKIKSGSNAFAPAQCKKGEGVQTYLDGIENYLQRFAKTSNQLRTVIKSTERKTIETAKNSQKTTGSSDNTVLIVVVALLSVFALAVGVWVGRLSSEMKIPQDAQLGPVTVETV